MSVVDNWTVLGYDYSKRSVHGCPNSLFLLNPLTTLVLLNTLPKFHIVFSPNRPACRAHCLSTMESVNRPKIVGFEVFTAVTPSTLKMGTTRSSETSV